MSAPDSREQLLLAEIERLGEELVDMRAAQSCKSTGGPMGTSRKQSDPIQPSCERTWRDFDRLLDARARAEQRAEAAEEKVREFEEHERTVKSLSMMLGWENVPPRETLEHDLRARKALLAKAEQEATEEHARRMETVAANAQLLQEATALRAVLRDVLDEAGPQTHRTACSDRMKNAGERFARGWKLRVCSGCRAEALLANPAQEKSDG